MNFDKLAETNFDRRRAWDYWRGFIWKNKHIYLWGIFFVISTNLAQVFSTRAMGWVLDFFTQDPLPRWFLSYPIETQFKLLFLFILLSYIVLALGRIGWRLTLARQTHTASAELKSALWKRARYFKYRDLQEVYTKGLLMNAATSDVRSARFIFGFTLVAFFDVVFLGSLTILMMLSIHVPLTILVILSLSFVPWAIKKLSAIEISRYDIAQEYLGKFDDLCTQVVSTIRLQRMSQTGEYWLKKLLEHAEVYRQKRLLSAYTSLRYIPIMGGSSVATYLVLFLAGIYFVFLGEISIGDFVALQGLIFLLQGPLMEVGFIVSEWRKSMTSLSRLTDITAHPQEDYLLKLGEDEKRSTVQDFVPILEVRNLSFSYPNSSPLFSDLSFKLKKGERLGITGAIGTGKSTLLRILSGLEREGLQGDVLYRERPFSSYSHELLRKNILHVYQKPFLFSQTIYENMIIGLEGEEKLSREEVWFYLELAALKKDIAATPHGLDTSLGEWGLNLSGGQKQRLALARALSRRPELLLLDDCLSAVDTLTEEKILKNLDRELKATTLIWVAHRKSTLKYCDHYLEL